MILVTGGAGYIGSHFINRYLQQKPDGEVVVIDNLSEGNLGAIEALQSRHGKRIIFYETDIGHPQVADILKRHPVGAVVHFAASALVPESQREPMKYLKNNVAETMRLLESMQTADVSKLVFSSTCAVYGNPETGLIHEELPRNPVNVYGRTKLMVEDMLALLHERGQLDYIALRYFNAAGADPDGLLGESHPHETHLIPIVLEAASGKRPEIKMYGDDYPTPDGTCVRDYIHIYDLADAHIKALEVLESGQTIGTAFNLGTGKGDSVKEVVELCREVTGRPIPAQVAERREGDPPMLVASPEKAKKFFSWTPRYALREIIETAWHWEQNRKF